jgi:hypothetical protein
MSGGKTGTRLAGPESRPVKCAAPVNKLATAEAILARFLSTKGTSPNPFVARGREVIDMKYETVKFSPCRRRPNRLLSDLRQAWPIDRHPSRTMKALAGRPNARPVSRSRSAQWFGIPGSARVPSSSTASSEYGFNPNRSRIVGAIWVVSTQPLYIAGFTTSGE